MLILGSTTRDPELIRLWYDLSLGLSKALLGILACIATLEELVSNYKLGNHLGIQLRVQVLTQKVWEEPEILHNRCCWLWTPL